MRSDWDIVTVYLVDRGSVRIATATELGRLPGDLDSLPVLALPVVLGTQQSWCQEAGEVEGIISTTNSRLHLSVLAFAQTS